MPAPVDLTGRVFGDLEVIRKVGRDESIKTVSHSWIWLCHCRKCGRDEEITQGLIPYTPNLAKKSKLARYACTICMRGPCEICGAEIEDGTYVGVCSESCYLERRRKNFRNYHYRQLEEDPDYWKKTAAQKLAKLDCDPEKKERFLQKDRERNRKYRDLNRDAINARARESYARTRDEVIARRKKRLAAMSAEERLMLEINQRQYAIEWWSKNGKRVLKERKDRLRNMSADERERYVRQRREYNRERRLIRDAEKALSDLMSIGEQLNELGREK
jgi:hypothetical protein